MDGMWKIAFNLDTARISNKVPIKKQPKELLKQDNEEKLNDWNGKAMYQQYLRQTGDKDKINTWKWLSKSNMKEGTEVLICSAQEQALRINYVKFDIDKTAESLLCRIRRVKNKTV